MKVYKGWIANYFIYWIVKDSEVKCIDRLVRNEYVIAHTIVKPLYLKEEGIETSWLEVLVVTGITKEQVLRAFKEQPEIRTSFAFPRPNNT
jgi:anaerobic selenocysteine-containing dehydrogenase